MNWEAANGEQNKGECQMNLLALCPGRKEGRKEIEGGGRKEEGRRKRMTE
jgi:hypothetical protein